MRITTRRKFLKGMGLVAVASTLPVGAVLVDASKGGPVTRDIVETALAATGEVTQGSRKRLVRVSVSAALMEDATALQSVLEMYARRTGCRILEILPGGMDPETGTVGVVVCDDNAA